MSRFVKLLTAVMFLLIAETANAAVNVDATQMLINISTQIGPWMQVVTGGAYVFGVGLVVRGVYLLKQYGQALTMSSTQNSLKAPLTNLFVGAALIYFPTMTSVLLASSFGTDNILAYADWTGPQSFQGVTLSAIFKIVQFVGLVAFIRGWALLAKGSSGGQSQVGKGVTHIIGGILAMNVVGTANMLSASLGVSFF